MSLEQLASFEFVMSCQPSSKLLRQIQYFRTPSTAWLQCYHNRSNVNIIIIIIIIIIITTATIIIIIIIATTITDVSDYHLLLLLLLLLLQLLFSVLYTSFKMLQYAHVEITFQSTVGPMEFFLLL